MAKVVGSVVSTQKDKSLIGRKLMIVQAVDSQGKPARPEEVAVDSVGAGIGEYVLLVRGAAQGNQIILIKLSMTSVTVPL